MTFEEKLKWKEDLSNYRKDYHKKINIEFNQRIEKQQPIVAPNDIKRYFVTPKESGELCLMSCIFIYRFCRYLPF